MYSSLLFYMKVEDMFAMYFYTASSCFINSITDEKAIIQGNLRIFGNSQLSLMLRLFFLTFEKKFACVIGEHSLQHPSQNS
jgi:hypothetical protein